MDNFVIASFKHIQKSLPALLLKWNLEEQVFGISTQQDRILARYYASLYAFLIYRNIYNNGATYKETADLFKITKFTKCLSCNYDISFKEYLAFYDIHDSIITCGQDGIEHNSLEGDFQIENSSCGSTITNVNPTDLLKEVDNGMNCKWFINTDCNGSN